LFSEFYEALDDARMSAFALPPGGIDDDGDDPGGLSRMSFPLPENYRARLPKTEMTASCRLPLHRSSSIVPWPADEHAHAMPALLNLP
jgi:hypothetical protein